jgi:hypothetical protein
MISLAGEGMKKDFEMKDFKRTALFQQAGQTLRRLFVDIPSTFTEAQAESILAISKIKATDSGLSEQLLQAWTPERFTEAQVRCVREMLELEVDDLRATIADAMEPCELRQRLCSRREGDPVSRVEVDVPHEAEGMGLDLMGARPSAR